MDITFPNESSIVIRFAKDPRVIGWDEIPAAMVVRLAEHGLKQLVDDKMAGAAIEGGQLIKGDKPLKIAGEFMHDGVDVFNAMVKRLSSGDWSEKKPGAGTKVSRLPWASRWLYGLCEEKAPAFILAGKLAPDGKVDRAPTKKNLAAMRELLFTSDAFARWRDAMMAKCPPEPEVPELSEEDLEALGLAE